MSKRKFNRYTKRLQTEFIAAGMKNKGISSDLSKKGIFIRTQHGFVPGTIIDIRLQLPDGRTSNLKGIVRRTIKVPLNLAKNGMGVELTEFDRVYTDFLAEHILINDPDAILEPSTSATALDADDNVNEHIVISCGSCSVKNRVKVSMLHLRPKCGKCGAYLT